MDAPHLKTPLPGPKAKEAHRTRSRPVSSPSYTHYYPLLVIARGAGAMVEDVDGNVLLDCAAGIAVTSTGHCHPTVVAAIVDQAQTLLHMSGTDFLLRAAGAPSWANRLARHGARARARLRTFFRQLRHRGHRGGHQAGALPDQALRDSRLPRQLPRPHAWAPSHSRASASTAQRLRPDAAGVHHVVYARLPPSTAATRAGVIARS